MPPRMGYFSYGTHLSVRSLCILKKNVPLKTFNDNLTNLLPLLICPNRKHRPTQITYEAEQRTINKPKARIMSQLRKCVVCGGSDHKDWIKKSNHQIVKCITCGFAFIHPMPKNMEISELYSYDYFEKGKYKDYGYDGYLKKKRDILQMQGRGLAIYCITGRKGDSLM